MKTIMLSVALAVGLLASTGSYAQVPASAPAGTTGLCKDGTFYSGATKKGACRGHKGVQAWYGASTGAAATAAAPAAPAPAAAKPATKPATAAAPGGAPGQVWVNTKTKVYHCPGDRWYGKTKSGEYLSEADAKAQGFRPDHNKACQ